MTEKDKHFDNDIDFLCYPFGIIITIVFQFLLVPFLFDSLLFSGKMLFFIFIIIMIGANNASKNTQTNFKRFLFFLGYTILFNIGIILIYLLGGLLIK